VVVYIEGSVTGGKKKKIERLLDPIQNSVAAKIM